MDARKVLIGALGDIAPGAVFHRSQIYDHLIERGYAPRTAENALTPSRRNGLIATLLADGVIERYGPKTYRVIDGQKIEARKPNYARVVMYQGQPREGWKPLGLMSDPEPGKVDWMLCGQRYAEGCWNLKLYADGRVPHKANYWLQYRHGALHGSDAPTLKAHMRDIYQNVLDDMKEIEEHYV